MRHQGRTVTVAKSTRLRADLRDDAERLARQLGHPPCRCAQGNVAALGSLRRQRILLVATRDDT